MPILQMKNWSTESSSNFPDRDHTANNWQNQDSNPSLCGSQDYMLACCGLATVPAPCLSLPNGRGLCWADGYLWINRQLGGLVLELNPKGNNIWEGVSKANSCRQNELLGHLLLFSSLKQCVSNAFSRDSKSIDCLTLSCLTCLTNIYNYSQPFPTTGPQAQPQNPFLQASGNHSLFLVTHDLTIQPPMPVLALSYRSWPTFSLCEQRYFQMSQGKV